MRVRVGGIEFGHRHGHDYRINDFSRAPKLNTERVGRPLGDGQDAGRDTRPGDLLAFKLHTNARNMSEALAASARLEAIWNDPAARLPGAVVAMEVDPDDSGTWHLLYGRFDRFTGIKPDYWAASGAGTIIADFELLDPRKYSTVLRSQSIGLHAESSGGLIFPLVFPMTTTISGAASSRFVEVGGDAPTPLAVTFHGPLVDPEIEIGGQVVGIEGAVAADLPITVDARTQTVTRGDGVAVPGRVTRRSRLDALNLSPGVHEVAFTGISPSGTGYVELSWRDATWGL